MLLMLFYILYEREIGNLLKIFWYRELRMYVFIIEYMRDILRFINLV